MRWDICLSVVYTRLFHFKVSNKPSMIGQRKKKKATSPSLYSICIHPNRGPLSVSWTCRAHSHPRVWAWVPSAPFFPLDSGVAPRKDFLDPACHFLSTSLSSLLSFTSDNIYLHLLSFMWLPICPLQYNICSSPAKTVLLFIVSPEPNIMSRT